VVSLSNHERYTDSKTKNNNQVGVQVFVGPPLCCAAQTVGRAKVYVKLMRNAGESSRVPICSDTDLRLGNR
jgi:hypothetical protein